MKSEVGGIGKGQISAGSERDDFGNGVMLSKLLAHKICVVCVWTTLSTTFASARYNENLAAHLHGLEPHTKVIKKVVTSFKHQYDVLETVKLVSRQLRDDIDIGEHGQDSTHTNRVETLLGACFEWTETRKN